MTTLHLPSGEVLPLSRKLGLGPIGGATVQSAKSDPSGNPAGSSPVAVSLPPAGHGHSSDQIHEGEVTRV